MGEVNEVIKASILRSFTAREVELDDSNRAVSWRWSAGVILFPEGICPWCKENIRSNRIWKVVDRQLVGRWKVLADGKVALDDKANHPHASGGDRGGNICMGSAESVTAALFLNMNPNDCYWGSEKLKWHPWLREVWDHDCGALGTPCVGHIDQAICQSWGCPVIWHAGVVGCDCGCFCHPLRARCRCGHAACRCGGDNAMPSANAEETIEDAEDGDEDEADTEFCSSCDTSFEDTDRSMCCTDRCEECHADGREDF